MPTLKIDLATRVLDDQMQVNLIHPGARYAFYDEVSQNSLLPVDLPFFDVPDGQPAAPLPSESKAKSSALKDAPRVQFSFTNVPKPIKDAFAAEAKKRQLTLKELLYECLRAGGIDIPANAEIDGRRR